MATPKKSDNIIDESKLKDMIKSSFDELEKEEKQITE